MTMLPRWMRVALFATAVMNIMAAVGFLPGAAAMRAQFGFPEGEHPFYLAVVTQFVLLFGLGYLWAALAGRAERLFITLAAFGKLSFFLIVTGFWVAGALPARAPLAGAADLAFALLFFRWLYDDRTPVLVGARRTAAIG